MLRFLTTMVIAACTSAAFAQDPAPATTAVSAPATAVSASRDKTAALPIVGRDALSEIEASKVLRVGVAINAPWVMHDRNGELIGYSVDVARKLTADMGWKLELVPTSWPGLLYELRTARSDVVISGLSITPQRALEVRFSEPYGEYDVAVVVNRAKFPQGDTRELAAAAGKRIGAHKGTLNVEYAHEGLPLAEIVEVDDEQQAVTDLREGRLDGYVAEAAMPLLLEKLYPKELRALVKDPLAHTAHGFAVRKGDHDLLDVFNAWIVQRQSSGWLNSRELYWFGSTEWASQL